jgi:putative chitinase
LVKDAREEMITMSIWTYLKGKKAQGYNNVIKNSHYNDPFDTTEGRLQGNSRESGDVAQDVADNVKALLVDKWRWAGLSYDLISIGLSIVSVESGFNPDAAAGTTSAAGLLQYVTDDSRGSSRWTQLVNRYNSAHPDDIISTVPVKYYGVRSTLLTGSLRFDIPLVWPVL